MAFATVPLSPFVDSVSLIDSATLNYWRVSLGSAVDGVGGSGGVSYTPATVISIEGLGMSIDPLSAHVRTGHFIEVNTGGLFQVLGGGLVQLDNFSNVHANKGSLFTEKGTFTITDDGQASPAGRLFVGLGADPGHVILQGNGEIQVGNGGAGVGHINVTALGDVTLSGLGSLIALTNQAAMTSSANSTVTLNGINTYNGVDTFNGVTVINDLASATQSGPLTKSGTSGKTSLRVGTPAGFDSDLTFDPSEFDIIEVDLLTANRTWTLSNPSGGKHPEVVIRDMDVTGSGTFTLTVLDSGGTAIASAPNHQLDQSKPLQVLRIAHVHNSYTGSPGFAFRWRRIT